MTKATPKRVVILGGSFDPPTVGHVQTAVQIWQCGHADEVWMIPCGRRPDKATVAAAEQRLEMTRLAVKDLVTSVPVMVDDIEIREGNFIPTYFLLQRLQALHPGVEFRLAVDEHLLTTVARWIEGPLLCRDGKFVSLPRLASGECVSKPPVADDACPVDVVRLDSETAAGGAVAAECRNTLFISNVSSTAVRRRFGAAAAEGDNISGCCAGYVTPSVIEFIVKEGLYQESRARPC